MSQSNEAGTYSISFTLEPEADLADIISTLEVEDDPEYSEDLEGLELYEDLDDSEEPADSEDPKQVVYVRPAEFKMTTANRSVQVFEMNGCDDHCLHIMENIRHPNILRSVSVACQPKTILVQPYDGVVMDYLRKYFQNLSNSREDILGTVRTVFRQVISASVYLMDHDLFHGRFSLQNTYYIKKSSELVIKLANFEALELSDWPCELPERWSEDWCLIGKALETVVAMITKFRADVLPFTGEMKELSFLLKDRKICASEMKKMAPDHYFFWSPEKRCSVFTYNISTLLRDDLFCTTISKTFDVPIKFIHDENSYNGLLGMMNAHRTSIGKSKYNGNKKKVHYFKFVCGSYTHEEELKDAYPSLKGKGVDETFRQHEPDLCVKVMRVLKSYHDEKRRELQKGKA